MTLTNSSHVALRGHIVPNPYQQTFAFLNPLCNAANLAFGFDQHISALDAVTLQLTQLYCML